MTTQGDSRSIPGPAEHGRGGDPDRDLGLDQVPGGDGEPDLDEDWGPDFDGGRVHPRHHGERRAWSTRRRVLVCCAALLAVGAGGWVASRPNPGDWLPGFGPSSKDNALPPVVGNPPPTSSTDPNLFSAEHYFPPSRMIDQNSYKGKRSGARQGNDCAETLQDSAKNVLHDTGCRGYLTVSFSRIDGRVLTSVTVLRFADDATGAKVAALLQQQPGALQFVLPDTTIAAPSPAAGGKGAASERVEAVHHYVTVTSSRPADAAGAPVPQSELDEATRAASYTAGAAFAWQ